VPKLHSAQLEAQYPARWFSPRDGKWSDSGSGTLHADNIGEIKLPAFPDAEDWALSLVRVNP
jgi:hypothetical protein